MQIDQFGVTATPGGLGQFACEPGATDKQPPGLHRTVGQERNGSVEALEFCETRRLLTRFHLTNRTHPTSPTRRDLDRGEIEFDSLGPCADGARTTRDDATADRCFRRVKQRPLPSETFEMRGIDTRFDQRECVVPHGTPQQVASHYQSYVDAGMRTMKVLDYGGMAGLKFGARSAQKVRETEDEFMKLVSAA